MKKVGTALAGCLVVLALLAGCGQKHCRVTYVTRVAANPVALKRNVGPTVAVMPFRCEGNADIGFTISEIMAGQLAAAGGCNVVEPRTVVAKTGDSPDLTPQESGRRVGVPYVVVGEVTEFVASADDGEKPSVGVTARMIETATGKVVWVETRARSGTDEWLPEESVGALATEVCGDLAMCVNSAWTEIASAKTAAAETRSATVAVTETEAKENLAGAGEDKGVDYFDRAELLEFPEEADSPDQFGLAATNEPAAAPHRETLPEAITLVPEVPEVFPPEHYVLAPEEAAHVLEMFEDPYTPEADRSAVTVAEADDSTVSNADMDVENAVATGDAETATPAAASGEGNVESAETKTLDMPTLPSMAAAPVSPASSDNKSESEASGSKAVLPEQEIAPLSIGLDGRDFPFSGPEVSAPPIVKREYDLDDAPEFAPRAFGGKDMGEGLTMTLPGSSSEDDLDFFGRMSASLGLELVEN